MWEQHVLFEVQLGGWIKYLYYMLVEDTTKKLKDDYKDIMWVISNLRKSCRLRGNGTFEIVYTIQWQANTNAFFRKFESREYSPTTIYNNCETFRVCEGKFLNTWFSADVYNTSWQHQDNDFCTCELKYKEGDSIKKSWMLPREYELDIQFIPYKHYK